MTTQEITAVVLATFIGLILLYDLWAVSVWGMDATVSAVVRDYSKSYPVIPLLVGIVCGHFFWGK